MLRYQPEDACADCGRHYGDQYGFPDLVIPNEVWQIISPCGHEGGLLCPSCICRRLHEAGIQTTGRFTSGPLVSDKEESVTTYRKYLERLPPEWREKIEQQVNEICHELGEPNSDPIVQEASVSLEHHLTPDEIVYLQRHVSSELLVYMGHHAMGQLRKNEQRRMEWLRSLSDKLKALEGK